MGTTLMDTNNTTDTLERLAVDLDATPAPFETETAAWLTQTARSTNNDRLLAVMNDECSPRPVRTRAMSMLTAELLRAQSLRMW